MNIEFTKLKDFLQNKDENIYIKAFYYSAIIGILLILVVLYSCCKKKNLYYENTLYIENNEIILTINYDKLEYITDNNKIIINGNVYNYKVIDINIFNNGNIFYQIKISINSDIVLNDLILEYKIFLKEERVLEYIVRVLKGD